MAPLGNKYYGTVSEVVSEGDKTTFSVQFGRVKACSFGDSIASRPVQAGEDKWKVVYFPKGFTDPDYASVYITNVACDMDEGDSDNPDKITKKSFATVQLLMQPKPPNTGPEKKKSAGDDDDDGEDDEDDDDAASSLASAATPVSTKKSGKSGKSGAKSGAGGSGRSSSSRKAGEGEEGEVEVAVGSILVDPIEKELSQLFTNKAPSWGFEKLFDMGKLYNFREGYMLKYGENPEHVQNGEIEMRITIFAASGLNFGDPEKDHDLTDSGRQRIYWNVIDIRRIIEKIGPRKRLSSSEFESDGEWYFDFYPNGFECPKDADGNDDKAKMEKWDPNDPEGKISIYLHSSRRQVELGDVRKVWFRFGLKKQNPAELEDDGKKKKGDDDEGKELPENYDAVYFPPGSSCVSVFTPSRKCFGKHGAYKQGLLTQGREFEGQQPPAFKKEFILGKYEQGGAATFVLDMMVTDDICATVQHMLHEVEEFGHKQEKCADTQEDLKGNKVICYHCGLAFCKEVTNYQARMEEYGYEVGREYISDILMREDEHWFDGVLKAVNLPDKIDQAIKSITARMSKMRMVTEDTQEEEDEDEEDEDPDPDNVDDALEKKKILKERERQQYFEERIKNLRLEVEDSHFSKPICSKCAEKRKMLQACNVVFANQPDKVRSTWQCPDQNALATVLADGSCIIVPMTARAKGAKSNFRKGWKKVEELIGGKYASMHKAMSVINVPAGSANHAADEWIKKKLPKADLVRNDQADPSTKPGRNAMTLVRGNRFVEPLELCVQCNGRVNEDGVTPEDDEDAPRDVFCDVRFDVRNPPPRIYCLYSGKVFCDFCANPEKYKVPLPQFEALYDKEGEKEPEPKQVCFDAKVAMGATIQRLQPESKMPEEEIIAKRPGAIPEEDEDDSDPFEILKKIPCFGNMIYDKIDELVNAP